MEEIVEKLIKIERELKNRKSRDHLAAYNAGEKKHEKQLAFHRCLKRNRWVFGGNRSGKTECGAWCWNTNGWIDWLCFEEGRI